MTVKDLNQKYWEDRYVENSTGWDLGVVSPPLNAYIDQLEDKNTRILIPGCGNAYEADYLLKCGFKDITVIDISPSLVDKLKKRYYGIRQIQVLLADFFEMEGTYDLILEQTFFCALNPDLRKKYRDKIASLLSENGKLVGLLFDIEFEKEGPPFGGNKDDYFTLFMEIFKSVKMENCYNSHPKRANNELFIQIKK